MLRSACRGLASQLNIINHIKYDQTITDSLSILWIRIDQGTRPTQIPQQAEEKASVAQCLVKKS